MEHATIDIANAPFEAQQLAIWLQEGHPTLGFSGDPRLYVQVGLLVAANTGTRKGKTFRKGDTVAFRLEVWRHNEDGSDKEIIHRDLDKFHEIIPELNKMRVGGRGFEDTALSSEAWNAKIDKERSDAVRDAQAEMTEHLWKLVADRQNGRTTFRGLPGLNPEKQA